MQNVFVYGTLRAGEINDMRHAAARHGMPEPRLIGQGVVHGRLYDFGTYPGLVVDASAGPVTGDVYAIADALVAVLDEIEEVYPGVEGLFLSRQIAVDVAGTSYPCLFYPVNASSVDGLPEIAGGDWIEYRKARAA